MFEHITVLKEESVNGLKINPLGVYVDCTLGGAGHSGLIASKLLPGGLLIGLDQDERALAVASDRLASYGERVKLVKSNFQFLKNALSTLHIEQVDGVLFDLGVSSPQLDEGERGFSYHHDAPLDMRMDQEQPMTAFEIVNHWELEELIRIFYRYGEEKFSRRIADKIIEARAKKPIETTFELVELIKEGIPAAARRTGPHPARRTFQAIRIAVNRELEVFETALKDAIEVLKPSGRVAVITFHSLEDRICKEIFKDNASGCSCPPDFPKCVCETNPTLKLITRKPILPSEQEIERNPRARSAKLRIAEKLGGN